MNKWRNLLLSKAENLSLKPIKLLIPCYIDQCSPHLGKSLVDIMDALGHPWEYPAAQTCCGQFAYNAGEWQAARKLMLHLFEVFSGEGLIICPSASCVLTIRHHYNRLISGAAEAEQLAQLQSRLMEFSEWLVTQLPLPWKPQFAGSLALHQSCAARRLGLLENLRRVLFSIAGLNLEEISPFYSCCGFGGLFSLKQSKLSQAIGGNYLKEILLTRASGLVSADSSCLLHLNGIIQAQNLPLKVYHWVELLLPGADS